MCEFSTSTMQHKPLLDRPAPSANVNSYRAGTSLHIRSIVLTLGAWLSFIGLFVRLIIYLATRSYVDAPHWSFPLDVLWFLPIACYGAYLIESIFLSTTLKYVCNASDENASESIVATMKCAAPIFRMHVECYHYETRYRSVTTTDSDGKTHTRQESYQERVTTHTASAPIRYHSWTDSSTSVHGLGDFPLVKMEMHKSYEFADAETHRSFQQQRLLFRRMHDRDRHQSYSERFEVPGFKSNVLSCANGVKPPLLNCGCFFLATILTVNWPFRYWLERNSVKTSIAIRKRVSASSQALSIFGPLCFLAEISGNFPLIEALVYTQMYNKPPPPTSLSPAIAAAIPIAEAIPIAAAVPFYEGGAVAVAVEIDGEGMSKDERDAWYEQQNVPSISSEAAAQAAAYAVPVEVATGGSGVPTSYGGVAVATATGVMPVATATAVP